MNSEKISSYIGFSVKKGSVVFGLDNLEFCRKKLHLVLYSEDISENSLKKLLQFASAKQIPCEKFNALADVLKRNCKVLGILDKELAKSIIQNM